MEEESNLVKSKYSSGVNIIIRLDLLWKDTHLHSRMGSFNKWNSDLDRIWLELARDLFNKDKLTDEDKDFKNVKEVFLGFDKELIKIGKFNDEKPAGFKKVSSDEIIKRAKQYEILMRKQLFLARLENYLGKGTTEEDIDDYDFD